MRFQLICGTPIHTSGFSQVFYKSNALIIHISFVGQGIVAGGRIYLSILRRYGVVVALGEDFKSTDTSSP